MIKKDVWEGDNELQTAKKRKIIGNAKGTVLRNVV
jgi:hypothetical protein